ncbi:hypothetical protein [Parasitella parasitica]|uniref:Reverse transcriptase domain-containing protein n=1 Tax=Parasitella parasitica TaxID=35722 RepID=A0A0B7NH24_9FUNG|nr:hypothetical protein [Parasitella parasitica]
MCLTLVKHIWIQQCATIPPQAKIVDADRVLLEQPFTVLDLLQGTERTSLSSGPGVDGIPYAMYKIMLQHSATAKLALTVFNDALLSGDLTDLRNWRPLSMICCDAKIFTQLLNHRLMPFMNHLISKQQAGFIVDNGMILHATKLYAERRSSSCIALLLDKEKAYDRIHLDYPYALLFTRLTYPLLSLTAY